MPAPDLDLIAIGRASVDLYGAQIGGRLEDMASFVKAVGGCPANIAIGTARLGLRSALVTRVGDEAMGRFIREQLVREGVDVTGVHTDRQRLTALVLQGVRDETTFPLIFYRADCADDALDESDIAEAHIARSRAIVVTGTHFARPNTAAAQRRAIGLAKAHGARIVLDIDYRPNLWGLAGHGAGEERYVRSASVSARFQAILPDCDLIVGTEEEMMIAGGADEPLAALRAIRARSGALLVMKRGPMGCVAFPGPIPAALEHGVQGPGFPVEVYNVLGAGDAFMSGFLRGWLREEPLERCCAFANACGAFAVSRLLCSVEYPTFSELAHFLAHGSPERALRKDAMLTQLHWATTRDRTLPLAPPSELMLLALEPGHAGASAERLGRLAEIAVEAVVAAADGRGGFGVVLDAAHGREALFRAADHPLWIGRRVERPGSGALDFAGGGSLGAHLGEWPARHAVVCRCAYRPDDPAQPRARQERELARLQDAVRTLGRELMLEIVAGAPAGDQDLAAAIERLYGIGMRPDWWACAPQASAAAWAAAAAVIDAGDPLCRGIVMRCPDGPEQAAVAALALAARNQRVRGFVAGPIVLADPARDWLAGRIDDGAARERIAASSRRLAEAWRAGRPT